MADNLAKAMTDAVLRRLAGEQSYNRGLDYSKHGHVETIAAVGDSVQAVVNGDRKYTVTLGADEGVLDYSCDCSTGAGGAFCMHCVAAAQAWVEQSKAKAKSPKRTRPKKVTLEDAKKLLEAEDKEAIVKLVLDWANDDERIKDRLILYAAQRSGPDAGAATIKEAFDKAAKLRSRITPREAIIWTKEVTAATDSIEQFLQDGHATAAVGVCESALEILRKAVRKVDDSYVAQDTLVHRLDELHFKACQEARPDPVALAGCLLRWELRDGLTCAIGQYKELLGDKGIQAYRAHAELEWEKVPARTGREERSLSEKHSRITNIMVRLARESGDVEQLVAVLGRDLTSHLHYLEIAELYRDAAQYGKALQWAQNGLNAFTGYKDSRLVAFAIEEYHRLEMHEEALNLVWKEFNASFRMEFYKKLERHALRAGAWPEWRKRALSEIRARIAKVKEQTAGLKRNLYDWEKTDHSFLIEILISENNPEAAWQEAQLGGCPDPLWLRLADLRAVEHPKDAAPVYLKNAISALYGDWRNAVRLFEKAALTMQRSGQGPEFKTQMKRILAKYKSNRQFIGEVERSRQNLYLPD